MGCRLSHLGLVNHRLDVLPFDGLPLEYWSAEDVDRWFRSLPPDLQQYRKRLPHDAGYIVARIWTVQYLSEEYGVPPRDSTRLIAYRDQVKRRQQQPPPPAASSSVLTKSTSSTGPAAAPTGADGPALLPGQVPDDTATDGIDGLDPADKAAGTPPAADAPGGPRPLMLLFAEWGATAVHQLRFWIDQTSEVLPEPGKQAAKLISQLLSLVDTAIANKQNLRDLLARVLAMLEILEGYHATLVQLGMYKAIVGEFKDTLLLVQDYARRYTQRNCVSRLLTAVSDKEECEGYVAKLQALAERALVGLGADNNARLQDLQKVIMRVAAYQDNAARAQSLLRSLGGLEAVRADKAKLRRVMEELGAGESIAVGMLEEVSSQLSALHDQGPHRFIRQLDLRVFWQKNCPGVPEVPWDVFWDLFPGGLKDNPMARSPVEQLVDWLADGTMRFCFQTCVEDNSHKRPHYVSVYELRSAFADAELVPQVEAMLLGDVAAKAPRSQQAAEPGAASTTQGDSAVATANTQQSAAAANAAWRQLPLLDPLYMGRDEEATELADHLAAVGSVVLVGPGGMGKSSLAADVGWRLVRSGRAPSGVLWVDLRNVSGGPDGRGEEVEARFMSALGLTPDKQGNSAQILAALRARAASGASRSEAEPGGTGTVTGTRPPSGPDPRCCCCQLLVVVDNAEDALLRDEDAAVLRQLVKQVLLEAPGVHYLVTSRSPLGVAATAAAGAAVPSGGIVQHLRLSERAVGTISQKAATELVVKVASDLSTDEADRVATACGRIPLVLRLAADALWAGRITLQAFLSLCSGQQSLRPLQPRPSISGTSSAPNRNTTDDGQAGFIGLVLGCLPREQKLVMGQLGVFPSGFDVEAAAAVLSQPEARVRGILAVLHSHSLLLPYKGGGNGGSMGLAGHGARMYVIHTDVRQAAVRLCAELAGPGLQLEAERHYVEHFLGQLRMWAAMYGSVREWQLALPLARDHLTDLLQVLDLLGAGDGQLLREPGPSDDVQDSSGAGGSEGPRMTLTRANIASVLRLSSRLLGVLGIAPALEHPCKRLLERTPNQAHGSTASNDSDLGTVADLSHVLALCAGYLGHYNNAEQLHKRVLDLRQRLLGEEHPETANSLGCLASCLHDQGRYPEAEQLFRRALDLRQRLLGEEHADTAMSLGNLAGCLRRQGRYPEAEQLFRRALDLQQRLLGEEHPDTAGSLGDLANCLHKQGRYPEAEQLYRRALDLQQRLLGEEHPYTATSLSNLAGCLRRQGRYPEAEQLFRRALDLQQRLLGEEHPDTANSLGGLAICLRKQGYPEAEQLHRQALALQMLGRSIPLQP